MAVTTSKIRATVLLFHVRLSVIFDLANSRPPCTSRFNRRIRTLTDSDRPEYTDAVTEADGRRIALSSSAESWGFEL
jgi:hypothetical protein